MGMFADLGWPLRVLLPLWEKVGAKRSDVGSKDLSDLRRGIRAESGARPHIRHPSGDTFSHKGRRTLYLNLLA